MKRAALFFIFLVRAVSMMGQTADPDTTTVRPDTIKNRFLPTGIRVGTDLISLIKSQRQDNFSGWEVNADVDFNRYMLALDYGNWARSFGADDSLLYKNDGTYWRAGVDVNFLTRDPERNVFFIGFRYGRSTYNETMSIIREDSVWGPYAREDFNNNLNARWYELTTGVKVKIWKIIWLGYTARMKFGLKNDQGATMLTHDVPGYGRTDKETYWGFNYQLMLRIPIREAGPIQGPKKKKKAPAASATGPS